jgi:Rhs element Vgr protein
VKVQGQAVPREHQLLSATVIKEVNRVAAARLVYLDGSASASDFPLTNGTLFVPGSEVEILAGSTDAPTTIFKGMVVAQAIKAREAKGAELVVECRHAAFKLTLGRKNATFFDQKDSDVISDLASAVGISADVEATAVKHAQLVQFRASDWDFLLSRAEANGKLVLTNDDKLVVKAPPKSGSPAVTLLFGATLLEFEARIDARHQWQGVKSSTWDPAQQEVLPKEGVDPAYAGPGNLTSAELAGVGALAAYELRHAAIAEDEAQAWADAEWLKSQMSKVSGRAKCEGIATVNPGDFAKLDGIGDRYSGTAFVSGVRHDAEPARGWKTNIQFGSLEHWAGGDHHHVAAPRAGALVPPVSGLQIGTVTSNEDAAGEHRVRVRLPMVDDSDGVWARVASLDAGNERGFFFRPEIGDEVVVGFLDDDPRQAVILGMLHSSKNVPPLSGSDDNHQKVYQSRSKMKISFDDDQKVMSLETPAGNKLTLTEADKEISVVDQNGNSIKMNQDGITIESQKALTIKATTDAELSSIMTTTVKGAQLKLN